ncbi:hypothetical protein PORCRE_404 [Porphyromonas crevioricanis JCM 15906]|uniref:Uncharacterized protein n=1 Tax=Porphyromonas crevioricanis JCM 15906 TaxID=1305617 RepID=S4PGI0_9PORP|nr:hypothetical protein PORCRE_404 [Porphyromonas crevioricanis JCM 15906]
MRNGLQWSQERENNQKIVVVHTMACFNAFSFSKKRSWPMDVYSIGQLLMNQKEKENLAL